MNQKEFIELINRETGIPKKYARKIVNTFVKAFFEAIKKDGELTIRNFGKFSKRSFSRASLRLPNGKVISVLPHGVIRFQPSKKLKDIVRQ